MNTMNEKEYMKRKLAIENAFYKGNGTTFFDENPSYTRDDIKFHQGLYWRYFYPSQTPEQMIAYAMGTHKRRMVEREMAD